MMPVLKINTELIILYWKTDYRYL